MKEIIVIIVGIGVIVGLIAVGLEHDINTKDKCLMQLERLNTNIETAIEGA